ncbi:hypothetical protein [Nocardia brasiliensis]|uniref:hypothetical protein n=1 Tax=Nocardia brasiliensis TaxID=37326 RepID=UPI0018954DB7|nr:hypothetical protein [Nocardia brasiliensis]MBF6546957.1 hypothetical protein [Nocardia brasiliensis]
MRHIPFIERLKRFAGSDSSALLEAKAKQARIIPIQEAVAVPRPTTVSEFYLEKEFDDLGVEQLRIHTAAGEQAAIAPASTAAGLEPIRQADQHLIGANWPLVIAARERYARLAALLGPFAKRRNGCRWGYFLCLVLLLLGDIAGLGGAAILYGEVPQLALMQAMSASVATVLAGTVGSEYKYLKQADERRNKDGMLPAELEPYRALLLGPLTGQKYVMVASAVAGLIALFVAVGIFALRATIEGQIAGYVFGALAVGIALGSWINSFRYADAVADKIEAARQDYRREVRAHARLARSRQLKLAEHSLEQARLIRLQHKLEGEAAHAQVMAAKNLALQQNPGVVGHGPAAAEIGRKPRLTLINSLHQDS